MTTTPPRSRSRKPAVVASPEAKTEKASTFPPPNRDPRAKLGRNGWVEVIETLDPVTRHQDIVRITAGYEFPWDYQRSLEFALFRTYCVPTISELLARTGEFEHRPQKRYDDTALLMAELIEHGYDAERGRESLRNINRMHGKYSIDNDDMLYVLSTFVYDPLDWIDKYGWRRLHPNERLASYYFYRQVGIRMGIKDIPETFQDFHRFKLEYERTHFVYSDDNHRIGTYTLNLFKSWYPASLGPAVEKVVYSLIDDRMASAFGFPKGSARMRAIAESALRARSALVRRLPKRRISVASGNAKNRTYPGYPLGYRPKDLGV
ncbi:oxygenase MpaB family protein [Rhodococcus chondri]|uniref:Oxygenase MpaB family protein n=1 Tax=Rhodococcus chondri TaxID=3065941 RepID=A0ABU7JLB8_9NOCA|nr:oxygenase MpaB family protein [Rhodococcus sp. CC-R104]MEE2030831.1 oxygenase MpaB family protein [Rhodococcus sp. CC-R104]